MANINKMICIVTTIAGSIRAFYLDQIKAMLKAGIIPAIICAEAKSLKEEVPDEVKLYDVPFSRSISPFRDLVTLFQLYKIFRKNKFPLIQYSTPKAALISSIAAFFARVPIRIYIMWGLYYMGQKGLSRFIFKTFERVICLLSNHVLPISHEMVDFMEKEGLVKKSKCQVMLNGSACGIDVDKYEPQQWRDFRDKIRGEIGIPEDAVVIGTVARITGDKGINELVGAFRSLEAKFPNVFLLLVGESEEKDQLHAATEEIILKDNNIKAMGRQDNPLPYYAAMDIFCLPTYREGFGKVNLEAQAMEIPVVSTDVIGPRESIEDGVTGFLVEPRNSHSLEFPLEKLISDKSLRMKMGKAGRERVKKMFNSVDVINRIISHRIELLNKL